MGVASGDLTPPVGIANRLWGAAAHAVASGIHRPLEAAAWVLGDAAPLAIVAMDGSWWQGRQREEACRAAIAQAIGTTAERVLLCLSHSHATVPLLDEVEPGPGADLLRAYLDELPARLAAIAQRAAAARVPGLAEAGVGRCRLAADRDQPHGDGWVIGHQPETPADDTLTVLRLSAADGRLLGVVVNYACHPTVLAWENSYISPDWVGGMRERIRRELGVPVLFLQGAGGELAPVEQYRADPAIADRLGDAVGLAALAALALLPPPGCVWRPGPVVASGADLGTWQAAPAPASTHLACSRPVTPLAWRDGFERLAELESGIAAAAADPAQRAQAERLRRRRRLRLMWGDAAEMPFAWMLARLGGISVVGTPAEPVSGFQRAVRAAARRPTLVINHCNGGSGYLVPAAWHARTGYYPAWQTPFAAGSLERLTAAACAAVSTPATGDAP